MSKTQSAGAQALATVERLHADAKTRAELLGDVARARKALHDQEAVCNELLARRRAHLEKVEQKATAAGIDLATVPNEC